MVFGARPYAAGSYSDLAGFNPAARMSAFNFSNAWDDILPLSNGTISALDRQHLWGLYIGIAAGAAVALKRRRVGFGLGWAARR